MNKELQHFIETMLNQNHHRQQMLDVLETDSQGAYVYYLAPYSNVIGIYENGGIFPRNRIKNYCDLSDQTIQGKRELRIEHWTQYAEKLLIPLHSCVNFFINPFNNTYYQFRRNALLRNKEKECCQSCVCILEIDLRKLLLKDNILIWGSQKNLAQISKRSIYLPNNFENFNWKEIYKIDHQSDKKNDLRSAEFIVFMDNGSKNKEVPKELIRHIYVYEKDLHYFPLVQQKIMNKNIKIIPSKNRAAALGSPLEYQENFVISLNKFSNSEEIVNAIFNALYRISTIESEIGIHLKDSFDDVKIANNKNHGISHVIRVMFWVLILCELFNNPQEKLSTDEITAILYAAFLHDSCRKDDNSDPQHGERAVKKYRNFLSKKLSMDLLERCLIAIKSHSEQEDPNESDIIWETLKDADAIDRGRFDRPNTENGCLNSKLRLRIIRADQSDIYIDNILWLGYRLPKMTNHINWSDCACYDFVKNVLKNFVLLNNSDNLSNERDLLQLINEKLYEFQLVKK